MIDTLVHQCTSDTWSSIQSDLFPGSRIAHDLASACIPGVIRSIRHIRNLGYSLLAVETEDRDFVVRIGARAATDTTPTPGFGPFGVAMREPTGQQREHDLSVLLAQAGAPAVASLGVFQIGEFDVMVMPMVAPTTPSPISASQWHRSLSAMWGVPADLPVFTAFAKTTRRIQALHDREASAALSDAFRSRLDALLTTATRWGTIHGDAHAGNAFNIDGEAVLYDFDTSCHGPVAWDLTHLLARAGTGPNSGFTTQDILESFRVGDSLTRDEVDAAVALRDVARTVARLTREQN